MTLVAEQLRRRVPGGIGTCVRALACSWADMGPDGPDVVLWASRPPVRPDPLEVLGRVQASHLPGPALVRAWDRGVVGPPPGTDVVHAPSLATPPPSTPLVTTVWDLTWRHVPEAFPPRGRRWHEAALSRALDRSRILIAPSHQTADELMKAGARADHIEVIPPGSDHLPPPDQAGADAVLDRLGVTGEYVLAVSTREPRKNLDRLVAAHSLARDRIGGLPLLVVGPQGWGTGPVESDGVVFAGWVDDAVLAALYRRARLVASVALVEGFGLQVVEAMRAGVPVMASPIPSAGDATRIVDPTDASDMAAAMVQVANDPVLRQDLVAAGHARTSHDTWRRCAAHHLSVLEAAVTPQRRARSGAGGAGGQAAPGAGPAATR